MHYGEIKNCDIANGLGVRVTLFVSGCTNHCENCFQPQTWDFCYGKPFTGETEDELIRLLSPDYINGLTLLGGEPFEVENQAGVLALIKRAKEEFPKKTIWIYSGFTYEELLSGSRAATPNAREILSLCDVLVDGRFKKELKNISLKFRGSENQRIIDLKKTAACGEVVLAEEFY